MAKSMLVNVRHVEESRVAVLEDGVLDAYEIETINRAHIKGNIYNAVVESVHPSLEAAFLRLTADLKGFLPLDEINFRLLPARGERGKGGRIGQHLHPGQKILAQVVREPFAGKPPTVSTYFSLPGRYLVLMPGVDSGGVSRKIEDAEQRDRLKKVVDELKPPEGFGLIVRTAGVGQTKLELQRDLRYLLRLWQSVQRSSEATEFPALVYREADLVIRTIRDHFTPDIGEVWIDSKETFDRAMAFVRDIMPTRAKTLRLDDGERPLFSKFNLEEQIESIYKRRVPLPSGGEIVIDGTEALTAIDVNSARSRRQGDAEEIALQTNLEAAAEIGRQLRLRDLGGLIVIDFIDMAASRNSKKVEKAMRDGLRGDKAKHDATSISKLGLMEISRQRIKGAKMGDMYATCPTCEGYGLVKNVEAAALSALRKLQTRSSRGDFGRVRLNLPPEVATWILNYKRDDLQQMERRHQARIDIVPNPKLLRHQAEIETIPHEKLEEAAPPPTLVGDRVVPLPPTDQELAASMKAGVDSVAPPAADPAPSPGGARAINGADGEGSPRRRRRRRRGRGGGAGNEAAATALSAATNGSGPLPERTVQALPSDAPPSDDVEGPEPPRVGAPGSEILAAGDNAERRGRRRRRRRGRGGANPDPVRDPNLAAGGATRPAAPKATEDHETYVPPGVRSDELMPAATGSRPRSKGPGRAGPRRRGGRPGPFEGGEG